MRRLELFRNLLGNMQGLKLLNNLTNNPFFSVMNANFPNPVFCIKSIYKKFQELETHAYEDVSLSSSDLANDSRRAARNAYVSESVNGKSTCCY